MKLLSIEKFRLLADKNGWSLEFSEGFVDGEAFRKRGQQPSQFSLVGADEYSKGFRTGYFERAVSSSTGDRRSETAAGTPELPGQRLYF